MASEAGAEFSGMEFSNAYGIAPAFSSVTKTRFYQWASFTYEDGSIIEEAGSLRGRSVGELEENRLLKKILHSSLII